MFRDDLFYRANDPALRAIAALSTMAHWRMEGRGPRWHKFGTRVLYRGADLNAWIARQAVVTTEAA